MKRRRLKEMNKLVALCVALIAVCAFTLGCCKKDAADELSVSPDTITEDNALEEADKVLEEIEKL